MAGGTTEGFGATAGHGLVLGGGASHVRGEFTRHMLHFLLLSK